MARPTSTQWLAAAVANHFFRGVPQLSPPNLYVGMFLSPPNSANVGGQEIAAVEYVRQLVTFGPPSVVGSVMRFSNNNTLNFPEARSAWGTPSHYGVFNAQVGGSPLSLNAWAVEAQRPIQTGDVPLIRPGGIRVDVPLFDVGG